MAKILVVEDDRSLSDALVYNLRREDHTPLAAYDAPTAIQLARQERIDLVLLDLMLPGGSGFDVCQTLRSFTKVPIIMLTARGDDIDRVLGLEIGADDYVTKPFNLRELMARVKANLRRVELDEQSDAGRKLQFGGLAIDVPGRQATIEERPISLQPKEFDLLVYLMQHPGTVLTRRHLLHDVWGHDFVGERTVDVHVRRVRSKLEKGGMPGVIRTVHGVGYAFDAEKQARSNLPEGVLH
jgi:DNA-binding response OmpR family regulator